MRRKAGLLAIGLVIAGIVGFLLIRGDDTPASRKSISVCNGSATLCDRPLNDVAFPATHNSFAGDDVPDFRFPQQEVGIASQLDDGIRGLLIDTYYGIPGERVYTDTSLINPSLNASLHEELGPEFTAIAARVRSRISRPKNERPRVYLCHGFCELGAVDALTTFREIKRFLDEHPGEVLIINIEDYVKPADTVALLEESGLADYAYSGPLDAPWPTLREMIERGQRVLIVAEHMSGGAPWYLPTYGPFQETPYDFRRPSQMSCEPNRGRPDNPLFLLNHWINSDPKPLPQTARIVNRYGFLLDRAQRCESERGLLPNLVAVDFYREGDLFGVVRTLNGSGP